jgi:hypothetical protein
MAHSALDPDSLVVRLRASTPRGAVAELRRAAPDMSVSAEWPFVRVQNEVEFAYGFKLSIDDLVKLVPILDGLVDVYSQGVRIIKGSNAGKMQDFAPLRDAPSKVLSHGKLRVVQEAYAIGADWLHHDSEGYPEVTEDAILAQEDLKEAVAPGNTWAETPMNDPSIVPYNSKSRLLRNVGMSEGGMAFDPGVEPPDVVEDRAVTKQRPHELAGPAYRSLLDLSRVYLMFDTVEAILGCLERIEKEFNVVSIDNGFHHPDPDGYPMIRVLVRLPLRSGRSFVAQLQLHHAKLYERKEEAKDEYAKLREVMALASPPEHADGVLRLVMEQLSTTRGKCRYDTVEGLATAAELEQTEVGAPEQKRRLRFWGGSGNW